MKTQKLFALLLLCLCMFAPAAFSQGFVKVQSDPVAGAACPGSTADPQINSSNGHIWACVNEGTAVSPNWQWEQVPTQGGGRGGGASSPNTGNLLQGGGALNVIQDSGIPAASLAILSPSAQQALVNTMLDGVSPTIFGYLLDLSGDVQQQISGKANANASTNVAGSTCVLGGACPLASTQLSDSPTLARLASPAFTGTPTAPTQSQADGSNNLATTNYVDMGLAIKAASGATITVAGVTCTLSGSCSLASTNLSDTAGLARLASPAFTGTPTAPTQSQADGSTKLATTNYVDTGLATKASSTASATVNGTTCTLGSSCTITLSSGVNAQAATYQVVAGDFSAGKTIVVASGTFTITLVASGSQPANGQKINILNYGSGVVTVARSGQTVNGGTSTFSLPAASGTAPQSTEIVSDGTNYFASISGPAGGGTGFNALTPGTATGGAYNIGTGGSLAPSGTGTIQASTFATEIDICTKAVCDGSTDDTAAWNSAVSSGNVTLRFGANKKSVVAGFNPSGSNIKVVCEPGATFLRGSANLTSQHLINSSGTGNSMDGCTYDQNGKYETTGTFPFHSVYASGGSLTITNGHGLNSGATNSASACAGTLGVGTITAATWTGGTATITTSTTCHLAVGNVLTVTGVLPNGTTGANYNVSQVAVTGVSGATISYAVTSAPPTYSSGGVVAALSDGMFGAFTSNLTIKDTAVDGNVQGYDVDIIASNSGTVYPCVLDNLTLNNSNYDAIYLHNFSIAPGTCSITRINGGNIGDAASDTGPTGNLIGIYQVQATGAGVVADNVRDTGSRYAVLRITTSNGVIWSNVYAYGCQETCIYNGEEGGYDNHGAHFYLENSMSGVEQTNDSLRPIDLRNTITDGTCRGLTFYCATSDYDSMTYMHSIGTPFGFFVGQASTSHDNISLYNDCSQDSTYYNVLVCTAIRGGGSGTSVVGFTTATNGAPSEAITAPVNYDGPNITNIAVGNNPLITVSGSAPANGSVWAITQIYSNGSSNWLGLNGQKFTVASSSGSTFTATGLNTTGFSAYVTPAGGSPLGKMIELYSSGTTWANKITANFRLLDEQITANMVSTSPNIPVSGSMYDMIDGNCSTNGWHGLPLSGGNGSWVSVHNSLQQCQ